MQANAETTNTLSLASGLFALWPSYFAYIFSFVIIGVFWVESSLRLPPLRTEQPSIQAVQPLVSELCIAFLPFSTAVLARYVTDPEPRQTAIILYALGLFLPALAWLLMWLYASRDHRLLNKNLDDKFIIHLTRQYTATSVLYFLALVLSLWNGIAGLALCVGLTLLYLLPQKRPMYRSDGA